MRILALVRGPDHVCARYRVCAFRPYLERAGHTLDVRAWPSSWVSRFGFFYQLKHVDALVVQRRLFSGWQLRLIRRRVRRLVFDYDDSIFLNSSYNPRGVESAGRSQRFTDMVSACDAVVAGNSFLRDQAVGAAGLGRLHVIPTCVDAARYPQARHDGTRTLLAWIGSSSTIRGLVKVAPVLESLGRNVPGLELKVICDKTLELKNLPVRFCPWQEATEADELAAADVGISWLPDDAWSRGKCGLKVLQYMAAGLPVVANPVGVQADMIRHGENGFLADTPAEWEEAIRTLAADPGLRRRMGQAGRRRVEAEFDVPVGAAAWLRVLDGLGRGALAKAS